MEKAVLSEKEYMHLEYQENEEACFHLRLQDVGLMIDAALIAGDRTLFQTAANVQRRMLDSKKSDPRIWRGTL